jgi:hypothetical protein
MTRFDLSIIFLLFLFFTLSSLSPTKFVQFLRFIRKFSEHFVVDCRVFYVGPFEIPSGCTGIFTPVLWTFTSTAIFS